MFFNLYSLGKHWFQPLKQKTRPRNLVNFVLKKTWEELCPLKHSCSWNVSLKVLFVELLRRRRFQKFSGHMQTWIRFLVPRGKECEENRRYRYMGKRISPQKIVGRIWKSTLISGKSREWNISICSEMSGKPAAWIHFEGSAWRVWTHGC